jgi:hypothetical protein
MAGFLFLLSTAACSIGVRIERFHGGAKSSDRRANERATQIAQQPAGNSVAAFFLRNASARVIHAAKTGGPVVSTVMPGLDAAEVLDALVSMVGGGNQSQRRAIVDRQGARPA